MGTQLLDVVVAVRPETAVWWGQARRDFVLARRNHEHRDYDAAVFFCEQAAQKALKALLLHRTGVMPPKTHNLDELGERAGVPPEIREFLRDLQPHYIRTRYPDAAGQVTNRLYKGRLSLKFMRGAAMVLKWCRSRLR